MEGHSDHWGLFMQPCWERRVWGSNPMQRQKHIWQEAAPIKQGTAKVLAASHHAHLTDQAEELA